MIEQFLTYLTDRDAKTVLDLGANDAAQSVELASAFPEATVHSFECSPFALALAEQTIKDQDRIRLHPFAVDNETGRRTFFASDPDVNTGAGSFYRSTGHEVLQPLNQKPISVEAIRLDEWAKVQGIASVDVVWADLQGAELRAFQGMGELLRTVQAVYAEVTFRELYAGQPLFEEVKAYLEANGLVLKAVLDDCCGYFGDAVFLRQAD